MSSTLSVENRDQVVEAVTWAAAEQQPLEVIGCGSKRSLGRPVQAANSLASVTGEDFGGDIQAWQSYLFNTFGENRTESAKLDDSNRFD